MTKRILLLSVVATLLLFAGTVVAGDLIGPNLTNKFITGDEPMPNVQPIPYVPNATTDSPGILVGTTWYDYQSNGSSGRRIVVDGMGGKHFAYMNGPNDTFQPRSVDYNYVDANGSWLGSSAVSQLAGAGYCQIGITPDNRAVLAYHESAGNLVTLAIDAFTGFGIFDYYDPPDVLPQNDCYWPYVNVDGQGYIHVVSCENPDAAGDPQSIAYTRSEDGGSTWTVLEDVDTLETISQTIVSSPVSNKVAIIYSHAVDPTSQMMNDTYYIESEDGVNWDWRFGKVNITNYGAPDSLYTYTDIAGSYDYNDNLNIIWNAQWVTDAGVYYKTHLFHYNSGTETITLIDHHPDSNWAAGCDFGVWNRPISKMSLGVHANNNLYAVYTKFNDEDCSIGGYSNGDIFFQYSMDSGASWEAPVNMTNSPSDAGGIPQEEGTATENPVRYLSFVNPATSGINDNGIMPTTFALTQNYPNPFNAQTNIEFILENDSDVEIEVYDITGAKVTTLVNSRMQAGAHTINWDAASVSSGIYYYTLRTNGEETTKKMTLLK